MINEMPVVAVEGSYGEMGVAYGRRMAGLIDRNLSDYARLWRRSDTDPGWSASVTATVPVACPGGS